MGNRLSKIYTKTGDDGTTGLGNGERIAKDCTPRVAHMQRLSALGKMVASLAHQVRTPLSAAMLYAANLGSKRLPEASRGNFHTKLMSRLKDLETQVNDMLLFAKSGDQQVVEQVSMQQLLTEVKAGSDAMVALNSSELDVNLPEPDIAIMGNKTALASAIQNLIHNSIQVIGSGALVRVNAIRDAHSDDLVRISVCDNGPGIDKKYHEKIFEAIKAKAPEKAVEAIKEHLQATDLILNKSNTSSILSKKTVLNCFFFMLINFLFSCMNASLVVYGFKSSGINLLTPFNMGTNNTGSIF